MDINKMRNIVILKNLPSNIVDEAFVVLKQNQKIKKFEFVENQKDNFSEYERENENEYIVKEAELLISNYITELEGQDLCGKKYENKILKKYKKMKTVSVVLGLLLIVSFFI